VAYCTQADLVTRMSETDLVRLTDHDGDGSVDASVAAAAIADAGGHIDSYLQVKYTVPLSPVPDVIRKRAAILSIYFLQLYRDSVTESMQKAFDAVDAWLKLAAAGKVALGISPKPAESPGAGGVRYDTQPRIFGRDEPL